ncbi:excinuclease ABC subunit A [Chachezhania antarctica]|uniref:excinuclease ABC subunit A n=1 Tax=Chachezhania antarctica TaxID=2340860 RepID=UPI000EAC135E|nr:excinuclease ABC subunit A [Chachezhania antarctica]
MHRILRATAIGLATATLVVPAAVTAGPKGCPPGLAKKGSCTPPGLRSNHNDVYKGDRVDRDYIIIESPGRYGFEPGYDYYRYGGQVYQMDRQTREVLNVIGAVATLLN